MKKKALWKDFLMEIKTTWSRFISIFLIVALGVAFFAGIRATNPDMRITADSYFDNSRLMDIKVISTWGLTEKEIEAISRIESVEEVEPIYSTHVVCDAKGNEAVIEVLSATKKMNLITVTEGRMPENSKEVLVDSLFLQSSGYMLGDIIQLKSGTEEDLSKTLNQNSLTIVGVGSTSYYLSFQRGNSAIGSGKVDGFIVVLPEVFNLRYYSGAYVSVKGARELTAFTDEYDNHIDMAALAIEDIAEDQNNSRYEHLSALKPPEWYVLNRNSIEAYVEYEQNADRIGAIGQVFPAIFFLVAALISLTTMTRMVEEERAQIGTLKALGYSKLSIAMKYILYALLATLGGSITGAMVGLKLLPTVIITAYKILYTNLPKVKTPFNIYYAALATAFSVLAVGLATFFACYKELKSKPSQLMRPVAPKTGKRVLLERVGFLWKHLSFIWKATIRNLFRYKKRFLMTVFGIGGCMALLLVGFGLKDSIFVIYTRQFDEIMLYHATVSVDQKAGEQQKTELEAVISENDLVKDYLQVQENSVTITHGKRTKKAQLVVFKAPEKISDFITLRSRREHITYELAADEVVITEQLAKQTGVEVGDTIAIKEGAKEVEAIIHGITENYMRHYVYMSPELYRRLFDKEVAYNQIYLLTPTIGYDRVQEIGDELLKLPAVTGIFYISYFRNMMDNILVSLNIVVWVLIFAAGALAYIVLYNLNNININERRRELATIKVLGFYDNELASYVYRENIILTIIGMAVGIVFGSILHRYVIETVEIDLVMFGRNIDLSSYIYSLLLTLLFSAFVNLTMFFKLKKINMVESLKSFE